MATAGTRGPWKADEDKRLLELVSSFGPRSWAAIAVQLHGRSGKQCRERWLNHLNPDIKKTAWTEDEDALLLELHRQYGNSWAKISKKIPGRTDNAIKNHWNSSLKRIAERHAATAAGAGNTNATGAPTSPTSILAESESASSSTSTSSRRRTSGARAIGKRRRSRSARDKPLPAPAAAAAAVSYSVDANSTLDTEAVIEEVLNRPSTSTPPSAPVPARIAPPIHPQAHAHMHVSPSAVSGMMHNTSMHVHAQAATPMNNYYATMQQQHHQQQQQLMAQHYWAMMVAAKAEQHIPHPPGTMAMAQAPALAPAPAHGGSTATAAHSYFDVGVSVGGPTDSGAATHTHEHEGIDAIPSVHVLENVMENMGGGTAEGAAIRHVKEEDNFCELL